MTRNSLMLLGVATVVVWVVPSLGTQGMGTIGHRVAHPDAVLFDTAPAQRTSARAALAHADGVAERSIGI